ncbi:hypothetical protein QBC40DRAFT_309341 [Triangularia verruculosa]|uniref:Tetraspanin n=1 Tax=Triangularia verruculosa TaxID=2587418 RepID=A0AAN6XBK9_9PEZI|nr:hypothetical protein QBC40DRAFT_309341 [Triangularia verruculosa]
MALLLALYILLITSLTGLAIYEHHTSITLSLPLSPTLTILTLLLPLLSLFTTSITSFSTHHNRKPLLPLLTHALQFTLTLILTTLLTSALTTPFTPCHLQTTWRTLWTSHNAPAIRRIQDALNCCGFRSTKDMSWPFPSSGNTGDAGSCEKQFNRHVPCADPWGEQLAKTAGVDLAVVVVVGLVQVVTLVLFKGQQRQRGRKRGGEWLGRVLEIFTGSGNGDDGGVRRPLLTGGSRSERYLTANRDVEDEDGDEEGDGNGQANGDGHAGTTRTAHTQTQTDRDDGRAGGPRVEVSHHDPWAGAERV